MGYNTPNFKNYLIILVIIAYWVPCNNVVTIRYVYKQFFIGGVWKGWIAEFNADTQLKFKSRPRFRQEAWTSTLVGMNEQMLGFE